MSEAFPDEPRLPSQGVGVGIPGQGRGLGEPANIPLYPEGSDDWRDKPEGPKHMASDMTRQTGEEVEKIVDKIKEGATKAAHQAGDTLNAAKQKGGEFLATPKGKNTAIGAGAITAAGVIASRIRRHESKPDRGRIVTDKLHFRRS